jgi:hypothetical protein
MQQKCFPLELGCKPGPVPALVASRGWWSFIWAGRYRTARATNLGSGVGAGRAGGLPRDPYSVLLRVGFAVPLLSPEERCALTTPFHPCRIARLPARPAVCFLLHFPSSHLDWPLASTLPWEPGLSSTANAAATTFRAPAGSRGEYSAWPAVVARGRGGRRGHRAAAVATPMKKGTEASVPSSASASSVVTSQVLPLSRPSSGSPSRRCGGSRGRFRWRCRAGARCRAAAGRSCCSPGRCRCEPW